MKLRNKKTGEIKEVIVGGYPVSGKTEIWECSEMDANEEDGYKSLGTYTSLAELNKEWEDEPEEPKEQHYFIEPRGQVIELKFGADIDGLKEELSEIGNLFKSREQAEKAVEKLKAWKRLKGTITRIDRASFDDVGTVTLFIRYEGKDHKKVQKDLDLLFGGEE